MYTKHHLVIPTENGYVKSVFAAFYQFLIEEATGCVYADLRLKNALDAARNLYSDERKALRTRPYFGNFNQTNTELLFVSDTGKEGVRYE